MVTTRFLLPPPPLSPRTQALWQSLTAAPILCHSNMCTLCWMLDFTCPAHLAASCCLRPATLSVNDRAAPCPNESTLVSMVAPSVDSRGPCDGVGALLDPNRSQGVSRLRRAGASWAMVWASSGGKTGGRGGGRASLTGPKGWGGRSVEEGRKPVIDWFTQGITTGDCDPMAVAGMVAALVLSVCWSIALSKGARRF